MKTLLEKEDIHAIAVEVAEMLKPFLNGKVALNAVNDIVFDVHGLADYLKVESSWVYKQVSLKTIRTLKTVSIRASGNRQSTDG